MQRIRKWIGLVAVIVPLGACGLLDVQAPGHIADASLNDPDAFPSLVNGMSYDLAQANDNTAEFQTLASGEVFHGGSYDWAKVPRGIILPEDVDGSWEAVEEAQWVTDHGIDRMKKVMVPEDFKKSQLAAQAYLYGGFADRLFGELACQVTIDSGPPQPNTVEFDRAIGKFTNAITIGQAAGADNIVTAAYAGRASVRAWKGDWAGAADDAAKVPVDFEYDAILNAAANNENTLAYETHARFEYTIWNTLYANHYGDPRVPWDTVYNSKGAIATGANGSSYMFRQEKYDNVDDDFPLATGTEMLVLRAEGALRSGDAAGAKVLLDQARLYYDAHPVNPNAPYKMTPLDTLSTASMATPDSAWATLRYEREATLFLQNRHLWDERRWYAEKGPAHDDWLHTAAPEGQNVRDSCMPISKEEANSNPNVP
ncbi:MAG TPA: hypothetical protein VFW98_01140 [Gemmatimonadaceae bacterium]|nr:hypothetical protein [Gemmatimonadaceae bacterium]